MNGRVPAFPKTEATVSVGTVAINGVCQPVSGRQLAVHPDGREEALASLDASVVTPMPTPPVAENDKHPPIGGAYNVTQSADTAQGLTLDDFLQGAVTRVTGGFIALAAAARGPCLQVTATVAAGL